MEKSTLVKLVWAGAMLAIPAAVLAVRRPEAQKAPVESRRMMPFDQPVAVDISGQQIEGAPIAEPVASVEAPKPQAMRIGTEKITTKVSPPAPEVPAAKSEGLQPKGPNLASVLSSVGGPQPTAVR